MQRRWLMAIIATLSGLAMLAGYSWGPEALVAAQTVTAPVIQPQTEPQAADDRFAVAPSAPPAATRAWLGVQIANVDGGVKVESVVPGSPAATAGLQVNDVITAVDGKPAGGVKQMVETIAAHKSGDTVVLAIKRGDADQEISVTLGNQPDSPAVPRIVPLVPNPLSPLGNLIPEWRQLVPGEQLERFEGGSFSFTDKNGQRVTVEMTAGKVAAVTANSLTIRPNGENADRSYQIGEQIRVVPGSRTRLTETIQKDDLVLVIARRSGDSATALAVYDQTAVKERRGMPKLQERRPNAPLLPGGRGFHFQMPDWRLRPSAS